MNRFVAHLVLVLFCVVGGVSLSGINGSVQNFQITNSLDFVNSHVSF